MIKTISLALILSASVAGSSFALEPIEGSIAASAKLELAPAGSSLENRFYNGGTEYRETYVVQEDGHLKLVARTTVQDR